jgi:hypothetical protein
MRWDGDGDGDGDGNNSGVRYKHSAVQCRQRGGGTEIPRQMRGIRWER